MNLFVITGTSRGLGYSLAQVALEEGHKVLGLARTRTIENTNYTHLLCDFGHPSNLGLQLAQALNSFNLKPFAKIFLINNAGKIEPIGATQKLLEEEISLNVAINLTAPMILTQSFLSALQEFRGESVIVNISSGVAEKPKAYWSAYSAAKAGLRAFTLATNQELEKGKAPSFASIHSFNPGLLDTQMQKEIRQKNTSQFPEVEQFEAYHKLGQLRSTDSVASAFFKFITQSKARLPLEFSTFDLELQ